MTRLQRLLLLGSSGYLGRTLAPLLLEQSFTLLPSHRSRAPFSDSIKFDFWRDDISPLLREREVDVVVVAANMAYEAAVPAVDKHEYHRRVNQFVQACSSRRMVYISSDGIFDGDKGLYTEEDQCHPVTPYGSNLQFFEERVREFCADHCIMRPSYLYGYAGGELDHRLERVRSGLLNGESFEFFDDMFKSPLDVNQAAQVISLVTRSSFQGTMNVAGRRMSIYKFYREAMQALGIPCERLHPTHMLTDLCLPRDTSLNILMMEGLGMPPLTIHESLARYAPRSVEEA